MKLESKADRFNYEMKQRLKLQFFSQHENEKNCNKINLKCIENFRFEILECLMLKWKASWVQFIVIVKARTARKIDKILQSKKIITFYIPSSWVKLNWVSSLERKSNFKSKSLFFISFLYFYFFFFFFHFNYNPNIQNILPTINLSFFFGITKILFEMTWHVKFE